MTEINIGKVLIIPKGEYDPNVTYYRLDLVEYGGCKWMLRQDHAQGVTPSDTNSYYWYKYDKLASNSNVGLTRPDNDSLVVDGNGVMSINIENSLSSTSSTKALSALQGKNLNDSKVDKESGKSLISTSDLAQIHTNASNIASNASAIATNKSAIDILNADKNTAGSVSKKVADGIAEVIAGAPSSFDTLKEISDWISSHAQSAAQMNAEIQGKVDKVSGMGLSSNDFTSSYKNKIDNLPSSYAPVDAEKNVQADWNESNSNSDAYIWNKPTVPSYTSQLVNNSDFATNSGVRDYANPNMRNRVWLVVGDSYGAGFMSGTWAYPNSWVPQFRAMVGIPKENFYACCLPGGGLITTSGGGYNYYDYNADRMSTDIKSSGEAINYGQMMARYLTPDMKVRITDILVTTGFNDIPRTNESLTAIIDALANFRWNTIPSLFESRASSINIHFADFAKNYAEADTVISRLHNAYTNYCALNGMRYIHNSNQIMRQYVMYQDNTVSSPDFLHPSPFGHRMIASQMALGVMTGSCNCIVPKHEIGLILNTANVSLFEGRLFNAQDNDKMTFELASAKDMNAHPKISFQDITISTALATDWVHIGNLNGGMITGGYDGSLHTSNTMVRTKGVLNSNGIWYDVDLMFAVASDGNNNSLHLKVWSVDQNGYRTFTHCRDLYVVPFNVNVNNAV